MVTPVDPWAEPSFPAPCKEPTSFSPWSLPFFSVAQRLSSPLLGEASKPGYLSPDDFCHCCPQTRLIFSCRFFKQRPGVGGRNTKNTKEPCSKPVHVADLPVIVKSGNSSFI